MTNGDLKRMTAEEIRAEERRMLDGLVPGTSMAKGEPRDTTPDLDRIVACRVELDRREEGST